MLSVTHFKKINKGKVLGVFSVNLNSKIFINDFKLVEGSKGMFVSVPSVKNHKGEYKDIVMIKKDVKEKILELSKKEYNSK